MTPKGRFLSAEWLQLVMLNYEIDASVLTERIPTGCELDFWSGRTFVSAVGFSSESGALIVETRTPEPLHARLPDFFLKRNIAVEEISATDRSLDAVFDYLTES